MAALSDGGAGFGVKEAQPLEVHADPGGCGLLYRGAAIPMRWAVGLALLMVLVFAFTAGVHLGAAYIDQMLTR